VARNATIDYYRKKGSLEKLDLQDLWYENNDVETLHALSRCLVPFLDALPKENADLLTAIDLEGRSQKEYAEEIGVSYSTLKSRVQHSRRLLRELFSDCCHFTLDGMGNVSDYQSKSGCDC
jgi:RNA polymerase sigma-70 factor (ECF subfamily)